MRYQASRSSQLRIYRCFPGVSHQDGDFASPASVNWTCACAWEWEWECRRFGVSAGLLVRFKGDRRCCVKSRRSAPLLGLFRAKLRVRARGSVLCAPCLTGLDPTDDTGLSNVVNELGGSFSPPFLMAGLNLPQHHPQTTAKMGQFEPLQNDLILRTARGELNLLCSGQLAHCISTNTKHRREGGAAAHLGDAPRYIVHDAEPVAAKATKSINNMDQLADISPSTTKPRGAGTSLSAAATQKLPRR